MSAFTSKFNNTAAEIHAFADAVAESLRALGFTTEVFYDVGPEAKLPLPSWLLFPNVAVLMSYPGVYARIGELKVILAYSNAVSLPRDSPSSIAAQAAERFGSTQSTSGSIASQGVIIPDSDLETPPAQGTGTESVTTVGSEKVQTTDTGVPTNTQASVPGGQLMSVYDQIKALASAAGHTNLTWDQWNWYAESVTQKIGLGPENFNLARTEPMPLISIDQWWTYTYAYFSGDATATGTPSESSTEAPPAAQLPPTAVDFMAQLQKLLEQMLALVLSARKV
jgi:hypothetical protein